MNASCFRLFRALIAAALFVGTPGAMAQTAADDAPKVHADGTSADAPAPEPQRGRGRQRNTKEESTKTTAPAMAPFPGQPAAKADDSKVICKSDQLTGTKVKRRVCGTAEQWAAWRKKNQENVDEVTKMTREAAGRNSRPDLTGGTTPTR